MTTRSIQSVHRFDIDLTRRLHSLAGMPLPISDTLTAQAASAATKARQAQRSLPRYLASAALAGAFVGVAVVLLLMVSASFIAAKSPSTKLVQGSVFGIALTLVVFAGAELFTGNVMTMLQGVLSRSIGWTDLAVVWVASFVGNLAGSIAFAVLVKASGVIDAGAPKGQQTIFSAALGGIVATKSALTGGELFFRAVLCNLLVCLALWMAARASGDAAKLLCLFWALLAFVASGFEHSIANMTIFSLAVLTHAPGATWGELARNLLWTTPGNILGGGLLVGAAYWFIGTEPSTPIEAPTIDLLAAPAGEPATAAATAAPAPRRRTTTPPPRTPATNGTRRTSGR
jgi:nitrite transporter NirC